MRKLLTAVLVLAVLAAGIGLGVWLSSGDDDGPDVATTPTSAASSTTDAPTTTDAPAGSAVVASPFGLLGRWDGRRWVAAASTGGATAVPVTGGEEYQVVVLGQPRRTAVGSALRAPEEFCSTPHQDFDPPLGRAEGSTLAPRPVAVHGVADPVPRAVTVLPDTTTTYRDRLVEELRVAGIDDPDAKVTQAVRVDLEGDGTDEVLVVSERMSDAPSLIARAGDYSVVFLRRVIGAEVRMDVVHLHVNDSSPEAPSPYLLVARIDAVADLNGDGVMEVVLGRSHYEGGSQAVFDRDPDGSLRERLAAGCGV